MQKYKNYWKRAKNTHYFLEICIIPLAIFIDNKGEINNDAEGSIHDSEIIECGLVLVLCCETGVCEITINMAPFT